MKIFLSLSVQLTALIMRAQLVDVFHEEYATGPIGELPEGFTVYRIYARLEDANDKVVAVYGTSAPSPDHRLSIGSMNEEDAIWNHSFGSVNGGSINCGLMSFYPELIYDSFITFNVIGTSEIVPCVQCAGSSTTLVYASVPSDEFSQSFNADSFEAPLRPDFLSWNATWTIDPNNDSCYGLGQPPDNRVLRITFVM